MPEADFQKWYAKQAASLGLDPNPDDVRHYYDWRAAHRAGAKPDASGHWPSQFKRTGHPRLVIGGIDTRTGQPVGRSNMPISKYLGRRLGRAVGGAVKKKPLTAAQKYERAVAGMEKRIGGRGKPRKPVKPLTAAEIRSKGAAELRGGFMAGTKLGELAEILEPEKKKP